MFHNIGALHNPTLVETDEPSASRPRIPWYRSRCWRVFSISLTCTGFLISFTCALYFMLLDRTEYIYCVLAAIICLTVFVHLVTVGSTFLNVGRPISAVPVQIASGDRFREVLRRTQSERGSSLVPERADLFHSLPAYILVPAEPQDRDESSNASTESTLSAESTQRHEEASELLTTSQQQEIVTQPAASGSSAPAKLAEAAAVISQIVKDSILDKEDNASAVGTTTAGQSSDDSSGKGSEANKAGVRQRRPTPMEAQEYIPLTENVKEG